MFFTPLHGYAVDLVPTKPYAADAGWDLRVVETQSIKPGGRARVDHGVGIEDWDPGVFAQILPRSSTLLVHGLLVVTGVVDPYYDGELGTVVANITDETVWLGCGDRISQIVFQPLWTPRVAVGRTTRGANGFGSSGH